MIKSSYLKFALHVGLIIVIAYITVEFVYWLFRNSGMVKNCEAFTVNNDSDSGVSYLLNCSSEGDSAMECVLNDDTTDDDTRDYDYWINSKNAAGITIIKDNKLMSDTDSSYSDLHDEITVSITKDSDDSTIDSDTSFNELVEGDIFTITYTISGTDLTRTVTIVSSASDSPEIFRLDLTGDGSSVDKLEDSLQVETTSVPDFNDYDTTVVWDKYYGLTKLTSDTSVSIPNVDSIPSNQSLSYSYESNITGESVSENLDIQIIAPVESTDINPILTSNKEWCNNKLFLDKVYITSSDGDETEIYNDASGSYVFNVADITNIDGLKQDGGSVGVDIIVPSEDDSKVVNEDGSDHIKFNLSDGVATNIGGVSGLQWNIPFGKNYTSYSSDDASSDICNLDLNINLDE